MELVFILFAAFIILLRKFLGSLFSGEGFNLGLLSGFRRFFKRLFEDEGIKLGVLFGFPMSILSFFFISFIFASGETSLTLVERVGYMIDLEDTITNIIRCSIVGFAAFAISSGGGLLITSFGGKNNGESEGNHKFVLGMIIFGLLVGGPCTLVSLMLMSNS